MSGGRRRWLPVAGPVAAVWVLVAGCARVGGAPPDPSQTPASTPAARPGVPVDEPTPVPPAPAPTDTAAPPADTAGKAATASSCPSTRGEAVLELVNRERARVGLPALKVDQRLVAAARAHAEDLARSGITGHVGSDGSEPPQRVRRAGYRFGQVGENVAAGISTAQEAMAGWMASEHHRDNIMSGGYDHIGIAFVSVPWSEYGTYWVQVFGSLQVPDDGAYEEACNP